MRHILAVLLMLISSTASAIDVKATWQRPTTRESGAALPADQIKQYELEYVNLSTMARKTRIVSGTYQGYTLTGLMQAKYGFRIRVYDVGGLVSKWSNQITADIKPPSTTVPIPTDPCNCVCP